MRYFESEVLSERALREIYLKPFEIAVKSGYVQAIMTSYNRVNGISTGGNYDLTTTILREDWGYDGFVMTDWWTRVDSRIDGSFEKNNLADMVKAQNDIYMVVPDAESFADDMAQTFYLMSALWATDSFALLTKPCLIHSESGHQFIPRRFMSLVQQI